MNMAVRTVIADDELLARQKLRQLLAGEADIKIVGEGATALGTLDLVRQTKPDLLFLDIQMPDMDGFEIVSAIGADPSLQAPRIVFTTAYDQYALRAFEINAVDYLLKPFTRERLAHAIGRVRDYIARFRSDTEDRKLTAEEKAYTSRIVFKSKGRILFLAVSDIRWIGAEENYVRICIERESHLLRETMARFETRLNPESFIRVHRSAIVNLEYVKEIRTDPQQGESFVLMKDGQKVPVSRGYRARIARLLARQGAGPRPTDRRTIEAQC
ncbi:LytR/AlgR family response regulator transcription factor [Paracidobacterium acidisoli]|uniref:DNA-binding response regulator n=1 Tax=Paracidobacterium acidisoli TaxID=2303751 RepID=A0A372IV47_9BACT|nr:LytTR family DNA-binding domain-containing protein [Paracidobacterium acidisoli]MBT9329714.1 LytTR family DNA-binding domain-containing protein [Paracidobacterium acidisoli]